MGTSYGGILWFQTKAGPRVLTLPVTNITEHSAQLNGMIVDDAGYAGEVRFEWGLTLAYGNQTNWQGNYGTGDSFSDLLGQLAEGTAYHVRAQFKNSLGITNGNDVVFSTLTPLGPITWLTEELAHALGGH